MVAEEEEEEEEEEINLQFVEKYRVVKKQDFYRMREERDFDRHQLLILCVMMEPLIREETNKKHNKMDMEKELKKGFKKGIPYANYFSVLLESPSNVIKYIVNNMFISYKKNASNQDGYKKQDQFAMFLAEGEELINEFRNKKITLSGDLL